MEKDKFYICIPFKPVCINDMSLTKDIPFKSLQYCEHNRLNSYYFLIRIEKKKIKNKSMFTVQVKFDLLLVYRCEHPRINILLATCFFEIHQQWTVYM